MRKTSLSCRTLGLLAIGAIHILGLDGYTPVLLR